MVYTQEFDAYNFQAWSGGKDTLDDVINAGKAEELESLIEDMFDPENPPTMTDVNDWLWFDRDTIYEYLGMSEESEDEESEDEESEESDEE